MPRLQTVSYQSYGSRTPVYDETFLVSLWQPCGFAHNTARLMCEFGVARLPQWQNRIFFNMFIFLAILLRSNEEAQLLQDIQGCCKTYKAAVSYARYSYDKHKCSHSHVLPENAQDCRANTVQ